MYEPALEQRVWDLLKAAGLKVRSTLDVSVPVDFVLEHQPDIYVAIEIRSDPMTPKGLARLADSLRPHARKIEKLILVTPSAPPQRQVTRAARLFRSIGIPTVCSDLRGLPEQLGIEGELNLDSYATLSAIQTAALVSDMGMYVKNVGNMTQTAHTLSGKMKIASESLSWAPKLYGELRYQFPFRMIDKLHKSRRPVEKSLRIGHEIRNAMVVLSDIKSFSKLVIAARAEDLQKAMSTYYREARELVWDHGGVLDKFIGDAVLAVFNYPYHNPRACISAVKFCAKLIQLGKKCMGELIGNMNEIIATGTRIGVTTGDIWPLNTANNGVQVSFVGNGVNLAARLEKACRVNCVLVDNRMYRALLRQGSGMAGKLRARARTLSRRQAEGQLARIKAWQIPLSALTNL